VTNAQIDAAFRRDQQTGEPVGPLAALVVTRLNAPAASKVRRICRAFDGPLRDYHEQRDALVLHYGENGSIGPDSEQWAAFAVEYRELLAVEVPVECEALTLDELWSRGADGKRDPVDVTADALDLLGAMGLLAD
jgi:hypothetical protein